MSGSDLPFRFIRNLHRLGVGEGRERLLVAISGGLDSTVLLHLLTFACRHLPIEVSAAHFDHAMRKGSSADARWVAGLCRAWGVPLVAERAEQPPRAEAGARRVRYRFLRKAALERDAARILTAHHADDQAETVLFRILRGTGLPGLRGIPASTATGLARPLLPFWREELEGYAAAHRLRWRTDASNASLDPARNRLRLHLLPEVERTIAPAARRNLVKLAELAAESEAGWTTLVREIRSGLESREGDAIVLARDQLRGYDPAVASRLLREVLLGFDVVLDRSGTRLALQFITHAPSGREMQLPRGLRIRTEHDRARIEREGIEREGEAAAPDAPLLIHPPEPGRRFSGHARIGGRPYGVTAVRASAGEAQRPPSDGWSVRLPIADLEFPLLLRGRAPGDRVRLDAGSRSVKKLMIDERVPLSERAAIPVLVDAHGSVVWVAGLFSLRAPEVTGVVMDISVAHE
jgi:tRNA(Ile)-lysidine synthase